MRPRRGLWIALSSILCAGVAIGGAIYFPARGNTHADRASRSATSTTSSGSGSAIDHVTGTSIEDSPSTASPGGSRAGSSMSSASPALPATRSSAPATHTSQPTPKGNVAEQIPSSSDAGVSPDLPVQYPQVETAAGKHITGELDQIEDEAGKLNARATAISRSLDTLRQQQAAAGLNLRGDISATQERMQNDLAPVDSALQEQDPVTARKYLDRAEREATKLENFLGQ